MQNNKKKRNFLNVVRKKTKMWPVNILKNCKFDEPFTPAENTS